MYFPLKILLLYTEILLIDILVEKIKNMKHLCFLRVFLVLYFLVSTLSSNNFFSGYFVFN